MWANSLRYSVTIEFIHRYLKSFMSLITVKIENLDSNKDFYQQTSKKYCNVRI